MNDDAVRDFLATAAAASIDVHAAPGGQLVFDAVGGGMPQAIIDLAERLTADPSLGRRVAYAISQGRCDYMLM